MPRCKPNVLLANQSIFVDGEHVGTLLYDHDRVRSRELPDCHRVLRTPAVEKVLERLALPSRLTAVYINELEIALPYRRQGHARAAVDKLAGLFREPFLFAVVHTLGRQAPMSTKAREEAYQRMGFCLVPTHLGPRGGGRTVLAFRAG